MINIFCQLNIKHEDSNSKFEKKNFNSKLKYKKIDLMNQNKLENIFH